MEPSFVGWQTPAGYLPPYAPLIDYPALNSAQALCANVAASNCTTTSCLNGVAFAVKPYQVDNTARLALQAGSPEFAKGVGLYQVALRAVLGGTTPGYNIFT
jgi:hypothetical protein